MAGASTFVDLLGARAERARAVGAALARRGLAGHRVLVALPPGPDFVAALLGCLHAGVVAVPVEPGPRLREVVEDAQPAAAVGCVDGVESIAGFAAESGARLREVVEDGQPAGAIGRVNGVESIAGFAAESGARLREVVEDTQPAAAIGRVNGAGFGADPGARLREVVEDAQPAAAIGRVDGVESITRLDAEPGDWRRPDLDPDDLALLQYTATGPVRGVMLTHGNLVAGATQLVRHLGMRSDTGVVSYLPPYRDLGLVGGVLAPALVGAPVTLVPSSASPDAWLRAVSAERARISFAPDLAYAWQGTDPALDLSTWDVAVTGAGSATLDRFADRLAPYGFRRSAIFPAYWSPEATALVSSRSGLAVNGFDEDTLEPGRLAKPGATALVDRGRAVSELDIVIVDPLTATRCPDGTTGEVWIAGPNVAAGYLGRPMTSEQTFCARLRGSTENYLRTGRLGFLHNGGLHLADGHPSEAEDRAGCCA